MTPDNPSPPPSRPGRTEPWRVERMIQRVPTHLGDPSHIGETVREPISPLIVIAGIVLLVLVMCGVLVALLNVPDRLRALGTSAQPTFTRTPRVVTPAVTIIPPTLPPPTPTPGPTAVVVKYKVKSGDSLIAIAAKYKVTVQAIQLANGLKDESIRAGDELTIPLPTPTVVGGSTAPQGTLGGTPTPLSQQPSGRSSPASTPGTVRHTVVKGDTLITIAATYGSTVDAIRMANQLNGDMLSIGQVLSVPVGAWTPSPVPGALAAPSATPTSQFAYSAPSLQWPPDNQVLQGTGGAPTLEWLSPASLKSGEFYVLHVDYTVNGQKKSIVQQIRQGTSYQLKATDYAGPNASGTQYTWYVVIVSAAPTASISSQARANVQNTQMFAMSPPSDTRTFTWQ